MCVEGGLHLSTTLDDKEELTVVCSCPVMVRMIHAVYSRHNALRAGRTVALGHFRGGGNL